MEVLLGKFTVVWIQCYTYAAGTDNNIVVEDLKNEIWALKSRCNTLESTIENLKSICKTHEDLLEGHRLELLDIHRDQGTLNTSYEGESYDLTT